MRYTEAGMALAAAQDELAEARIQAGANREATTSMARQIAMLVEDQERRRQEVESLRRQLVAITSPAAPTSTPMSQPTATPRSGMTTLPLPDPISCMYAGSRDRPNRSRRSRDRDEVDGRTHHSSGSRHSRDHDSFDEDTSHRSSRYRRSRDRDDRDRSGSQRLSGSRRHRDSDDFDEDTSHQSSRPRRSRDRGDSREDRSRRPTSSLSSSSQTNMGWTTRTWTCCLPQQQHSQHREPGAHPAAADVEVRNRGGTQADQGQPQP